MKQVQRIFLAMLASPLAAFAHGGHGLDGLHWHATDLAGFALVAVLAGFALWLSRSE